MASSVVVKHYDQSTSERRVDLIYSSRGIRVISVGDVAVHGRHGSRSRRELTSGTASRKQCPRDGFLKPQSLLFSHMLPSVKPHQLVSQVFKCLKCMGASHLNYCKSYFHHFIESPWLDVRRGMGAGFSVGRHKV